MKGSKFIDRIDYRNIYHELFNEEGIYYMHIGDGANNPCPNLENSILDVSDSHV